MSRFLLPRLAVAALLCALPVSVLAGGFDSRGYHHAPAGAGVQYHGKHGSLMLRAPTVRHHSYHGHTRYFGQPGTVIIERRVILPGSQWRGRGHHRPFERDHRFGHDRGGARSLQCGPSVCVRIR